MKPRRYFSKILVACVFTGMLSGCISNQQPVTDTADVLRVSVILPHEDDTYWGFVKSGIEDHLSEAKQGGVDVKILIPQLNYNVQQMTDLIKKEIAAKVDILVVTGSQDKNYIAALQKAAHECITIVSLDTGFEDGVSESLYIGSDNYAAGKLMGEKLAGLMGGKGSYSIISGDTGYNNLEKRIQGLKDVLAAYPDISLYEIQYDQYDALSAVADYYTMANADALVCVEGTGAHAIEKVIGTGNKKFRYIIGFDVADRIQEGIINGIVIQNQYTMGEKLIEQLLYYKEHRSFESKQIYTDIQWVDAFSEKDNS